jgi:predicted alpha-1,2-mannosidase
MNYYLLPLLGCSLLLASCESSVKEYPDAVYKWTFDSAHANVAQYVDPFIGTDGHGHTFPGATAPFGMVQLSPDTRIDGSWDGCSGYHHDDKRIYGFSHTHLSGTGCSDYGDIMLMPGHGEMQVAPGSDSTPGYSSTFSHEVEHASAGYYSVELDNKILCELTASPRVGVHRYTFNDNDNSWIILDMAHRDEVLECEIVVVNDHTIRGKRFSKAWATNQQLWFYAEFSEPFTHTFSGGKNSAGVDSTNGEHAKIVLSFDADQVEVKVGLSPVSSANAKMNLDVETAGMNFDDVKAKTEKHWNSELSCIEIETADESKKTIFYTALYHCFIAPNVYCDVNGEYQGMDHKVYRDTVHQRYTVFSLWDTYRALHPLFTIVQQKRTNDFINTFLQQYKESGRLPVWELSSNETDCMIGYHSVSVITDAWMKGITGYDTVLAYEAMKASAMENRSGLEGYRKCGFIPAEGESESVSKTLEYAYDDWCIAQCANRMGDTTGYQDYSRRAGNWKNLYNPETGFMQARMNNTFVSPFDPFEVNFHYTEANAWQYSLAVQHDPIGMIMLHGAEGLQSHLDSLFSVSPKTTGRDQADITGLIGQYAHGNEPSHHMAYLYAELNEDWKTQELVHQICNTLYTDKPDGLCGNEDCGQMSAWYVLSASGFYAITPGNPEYTIGSPQFSSVKFHLENGNTFTVNTKDADLDYPYVSVWQKNPIGDHKIPFALIQSGGKLDLSKEEQRESIINNSSWTYISNNVVTPWITGVTSRTFTDHVTLGMKTIESSDEIFYSLNGSAYRKYSSPVTLSDNTTINMFATGSSLYTNAKYTSDTATAQFFKAPSWKSISIRNAYAPQYSAGGDRALIDGLTGTTNFRTGLWQGYEGVDMDVTIDLGQEMNVDSVNIHFLLDENSWIFSPVQVVATVGNDTSEFSSDIRSDIYVQGGGTGIGPRIDIIQLKGGKGRFVHIVATSPKVCPKGHLGEGKPCWLFADEITIITK